MREQKELDKDGQGGQRGLDGNPLYKGALLQRQGADDDKEDEARS